MNKYKLDLYTSCALFKHFSSSEFGLCAVSITAVEQLDALLN